MLALYVTRRTIGWISKVAHVIVIRFITFITFMETKNAAGTLTYCIGK